MDWVYIWKLFFYQFYMTYFYVVYHVWDFLTRVENSCTILDRTAFETVTQTSMGVNI